MHKDEFIERSKYLNSLIEKKEEQLKKLRADNGRKIETFHSDGYDVRSNISEIDNTSAIGALSRELNELKAERESLGNSFDNSMEAVMKEQDEMIQEKKEQRERDRKARHEVYERVQKNIKQGLQLGKD